MEAYLTPGTSRFERTRVRWATGGERRRIRRRRVHPHDAAGREHDRHAQPVPAGLAGRHSRASSTSRGADRELLAEYANGPASAPPGARPARCRPGCGSATTTRPWRSAAEFRDIFGAGNFFLELMDHGLDIEQRVTEDLLRLAADLEPAAGRHERPALHAPRRRRRPRGAALRAVRQDDGRSEAVQVRRATTTT